MRPWRDAKREYAQLGYKLDALDDIVPRIAASMLDLKSPQAAVGLAAVVTGTAPDLARAYAAEALGRIDIPGALETLLHAAKTEHSATVQVGLAAGLGHKAAESREARELLLRWRESDYWQVRLAASGPAPGGGKNSIYGMSFESRNVVFVLDASPSMWGRLILARRELKDAIGRLPRGARFNVIVMRHEAQLLSQEMVAAAFCGPTRANHFIDKLRTEGATNMSGSIRRAMDFTGGGWHEPLTRDSIDTIVLICDGEPTSGLTDRRRIPVRIVDHLRHKRVRVHCIGVNATGYGGGILRKIAEGTGGTFVLR